MNKSSTPRSFVDDPSLKETDIEVTQQTRSSSYRDLSTREKENAKLDVNSARTLKVSSEIFKLKDVNISQLRQAHSRFQIFLSQQGSPTKGSSNVRMPSSSSVVKDFSTWGKMELSELNATGGKSAAGRVAATGTGREEVDRIQRGDDENKQSEIPSDEVASCAEKPSPRQAAPGDVGNSSTPVEVKPGLSEETDVAKIDDQGE
eukprot:749499-Hanusia_phi.AAC.2